MDSLVDKYFDKINNYQPLLHRPTFVANIQDGLHERDDGFGSVVLLVCASASRFSDDPRVFLEGSDSTHSSGWEWFRQVQLVRKSLLSPPRLYDLQMCAVSPATAIVWTLSHASCSVAADRYIPAKHVGTSGVLDCYRSRHSIGSGCRRSSPEGVYAFQRDHNRSRTVEAGVLVSHLISLPADLVLTGGNNRVLVSMDRAMSMTLGRPCAIQDEE